MRLLFSIAACLFMLASCAPDAERNAPPLASGENVQVINELMAAFNAHDADKMRSYWHSDVTWMEVAAQQARVATSSSAQLHTEMIAYFEAYPSVSSSFESIVANGDFISAVEKAVWEEDGERKSQSSIVIYEINDGKVRRFWYFPPQ